MKQQFLTLESYYGSIDPKYHVAHCIKVWEAMQLPSTSGELNACPTPQLLTLMRDSTDKIEQRIIVVEHINKEIKKKTQTLQGGTFVVASTAKFEHGLRVKVKSIVAIVLENFSQLCPSFRQVVPKLPEDITHVVPPQQVELLVDAWSQLAVKTDTIQEDLATIKL